jgi:hypothetical protein
MPQERWRTAGGDRESGKFVPPQVYDDAHDERERMSVTKAVGVVVTFLLGAVGSVGLYTLCVHQGLNALGVDISVVDALIASACFNALRYFDLGIVANIKKKNGN